MFVTQEELLKGSSPSESKRAVQKQAAAAPVEEDIEDESEDDALTAGDLAAASVPADLLDDSEDDAGPSEDLPPDNGADIDMNVEDADLVDSQTAGISAGPTAGQLDDGDEIMDEDGAHLERQQASSAKQTQLLDDDDDDVNSQDEGPPVASSAADAAPSMQQPEEGSDGELVEPSARAMELSSIDEAALALQDSLPASMPGEILNDVGEAVGEFGAEDHSQLIAPQSGAQPGSEPSELPKDQLRAFDDVAAELCANQPPQAACTEASPGSAAMLAALPETEQFQIVQHAAVFHEPSVDEVPAAAVVEVQVAGHASQEALEDSEAQLGSEAVSPPAVEEAPAACDGMQAKNLEVDAAAIQTQLSATADVPAAITQRSIGLVAEHRGASAPCEGIENQLSAPAPDGCLESASAMEENVAADVSNQPADESVFGGEVRQAAQADEAQEQQPDPVSQGAEARRELAESMTPELGAFGSFAQRSQLGSLSVTFSDVEMDLETGTLVNSL